MRTKTIYLCDLCERFAATFAIDLKDITKEEDKWKSFEPIGEIKAGCFMHPVKSKTIKYKENNDS